MNNYFSCITYPCNDNSAHCLAKQGKEPWRNTKISNEQPHIEQMNKLRLFFSYLNWYANAKNLHGLHSPFVYHLAKDCFYRKDDISSFVWLEEARKNLINESSIISYRDMGAGVRKVSGYDSKPEKTASISDIAARTLQKPAFCRIFHRIIKSFGYTKIMELGTSLGITTAYLASASKSATVFTIEGDENISGLAQSTFKKLNLKNISLITGSFDSVLPTLLQSHPEKWDMVYIDGNHNGDAVLNYFNQIIKHLNPKGVVVFDDIRWSDSMWKAWKTTQTLEDVTLTVDLFNCGLVFIDPDLSKESFKVKVRIT